LKDRFAKSKEKSTTEKIKDYDKLQELIEKAKDNKDSMTLDEIQEMYKLAKEK
jgi:spore coat polysaccharide biosynthesis protein SpsF (cytidylyltransferase family)